VLSKLGGAMGDMFDFEALMPGAAGEEGDEAEGEEVPNLHSAASEGERRGRRNGAGLVGCTAAAAGQQQGSRSSS
jgi:hypothetical protein